VTALEGQLIMPDEDKLGYSRDVDLAQEVPPEPAGGRAETLARGWLRTYEDRPNTHRAYRLDMFGCRHGPPCPELECKPNPLAWLRYCAAHNQDPIIVRTTVIEWWLADLAQAGQSSSTRARRIAAVSAYYQYLFREEIIDVNPVARLDKRPKKRKAGTAGMALSHNQVFALLAAADKDHPCHAALIATAIYTGMRVESLAALNVEDVRNGHGGPRAVFRIKGGNVDEAPLPPAAYDRIMAWQKQRQDVDRRPMLRGAATRGRPLFTRVTNGERINEPYVWRLVNRLAVIAGIKGRIQPHDLRRTFGTLTHAAGASTREVQVAMGHAMSSTTEGYDRGEYGLDRHPGHRLAALHDKMRAKAREDETHAA
jgi:integrase/recombinase XerD